MFMLSIKHGTRPSSRLRSSLCKVYVDLLRFFQAIVSIFTKKNGNLKGKTIFIGSLFWKPFDIRFHDFLERLEFHSALFKQEFDVLESRLAAVSREEGVSERACAQNEREDAATARGLLQETHKAALESQQSLITQQKDSALRQAQSWLAPPEYAQEYVNAQNIREQDTADWIFDELSFQLWLKGSEREVEQQYLGKRVLWIQGNPGSGKSVLAAAIVDGLIHGGVGKRSGNASVGYFFFRDEISLLNGSVAAIRSLLAQLLYQHRYNEDIIDIFAFAISNNSTGQLVATSKELLDLLHISLKKIGNYIFVLDGIDECRDIDNLLGTLEGLLKESDCKLILSSRPVLPSTEVTESAYVLKIGRLSQNDIQLFLRRRLQELRLSHYLPRHVDDDDLLKRLLVGADGMFLWARLMICYLQSPALSLSQRVRTIMEVTLPEGLEVMYDRLMALINAKHKIERGLAGRILSLIAFSSRPLSTSELRGALKISEDKEPEMDDDYSNFHQTVRLLCCGLVEEATMIDPRYELPVPSYRLIHLSAAEYFRSRDVRHDTELGVGTECVAGAVNSHLRIASLCLRYLSYHLPAQPLGGQIGINVTRSSLDIGFPFCQYASLYWTEHFQIVLDMDLAVTNKVTLDFHRKWHRHALTSLTNFLSQKFVLMSWIEASCTFGQFPSFERVRNWMASTYDCRSLMPSKVAYAKLSKDVHEFDLYLKELKNTWGPQLLSSPSIIWQEVTAFTSCRLLAKTASTTVDTLIAGKPIGSNLFHQPLCKISELSSDGLWVMILSVWPSRQFSSVLLESSPSAAGIYRACSGWTTRFEIWSTEVPSKRVADIQVPLNSQEIWLQVQQSLWSELNSHHQKIWKLHIPLAIHPTGQIFVVLRTVYELHFSKQQRPDAVRLKSRFLPLDFNTAEWIPDRSKEETLDFNSNLRCRDLYIYRLSFSTNGSYLSFVGGHHQSKLKSTVLELNKPVPFKMSVIRDTKFHVSYDICSTDDFRLVFHAKRPILAFVLDYRAYLWEFWKIDATPIECFARFPKIDRVAFSDCGQYLVIDDSFSDSPVLQRLSTEEDFSGTGLIKSSASTSVNKTKAASPDFRLTHAVEHTSETTILRGELGGSGYMGRAIHINSANSNALICTQQDSGGDRDSVELTKLPNWSHVKTTNVAVRLPQGKNETIQIILNKAEKAWYSISDPADNHLPAIVYRNQEALAKPLRVGGKRHREIEDVESVAKRSL